MTYKEYILKNNWILSNVTETTYEFTKYPLCEIDKYGSIEFIKIPKDYIDKGITEN